MKEEKDLTPAPPDLNDTIRNLKRLHKSVTTIFTFLVSSGRYIITTFDVIKPAVEKDIGRPLRVDDLAQIKYLLPDDVVLAYVDENQLEEHAAPITDKGFETTDRDIFKLREKRDDSEDEDGNENEDDFVGPKKLLIFEFIDGKVKPEINKKRKVSKTVVRYPSFSVDKIKKMIDRRVEKYSQALERFRQSCLNEKLDFITTLESRSKRFIPILEGYVDPVEYMMNNTSNSKLVRNKTFNSIQNFISDVKSSPDYCDQIVKDGEIRIEHKEASYDGDIEQLVSLDIRTALSEVRGITKLYSHQSLALSGLQSGHVKNVIVTTSTSSGKSLIYQLPVLESLLESPTATAFYIFPTKALAQDQKRSFNELLHAIPKLQTVLAETYDGDTKKENRYEIRSKASVIFTNPDMVHSSILPNWDLWRPFLSNLKCIVVDELHVYSGLFGGHVAFIMRRLLRILNELGNTDVKIISCSATIRNPMNHMTSIFGVSPDETVVINEDGSPIGSRTYLLWNCRYISPTDTSSGRIHPVGEASHLLINLASRGIRTIAFCKVRRTCELLMKSVTTLLENSGRTELLSKLMAYRGGYSYEDRRRIEKQMFDGHLLGIIATNALELGIDIGNLDAVLLVGFPFTISNMRQQCGRAGRRSNESLAVIIGSGDPIDQYYMNNPQQILDAPDVEIPLAIDNVLIQESHLQCGGYEFPIRLELDGEYFGYANINDKSERLIWEDLVKSRMIELELDENEQKDLPKLYTCHDKFLPRPTDQVVIRGIEEEEFAVVDTTNNRNIVIETVEASRTTFTLYEGGIFLHQGRPYLIQEFHPDEKYAKVTRVDVDWITRQRDFHNVDPIETELFCTLNNERKYTACFGKIKHESIVFGFFKIDRKDRIIDAVQVDNPPFIYESKGFWIDVPTKVLEILKHKKLSIPGAIHGAEHALLSLFPMFVTSLPGDVSTECKAPEKEYAYRNTSRKRPARIIFCDRTGGTEGAGISRKAFEFVDDLLEQAIDRVEQCECELGCPGCVASSHCREHSEIISKIGALIIFKELTGRYIDIDLIPEGPEKNLKQATSIETVIPASPVKLSVKARESAVSRVAEEPGQAGIQGIVLFPR